MGSNNINRKRRKVRGAEKKLGSTVEAEVKKRLP